MLTPVYSQIGWGLSYSILFPIIWQEHLLLHPREEFFLLLLLLLFLFLFLPESLLISPNLVCRAFVFSFPGSYVSVSTPQLLGLEFDFTLFTSLKFNLVYLQVSLLLSHGCYQKAQDWVREKRVITHGTPSSTSINKWMLVSPYSQAHGGNLICPDGVCTLWVCCWGTQGQQPNTFLKSRKQISPLAPGSEAVTW